jgi:hypothetical protein
MSITRIPLLVLAATASVGVALAAAFAAQANDGQDDLAKVRGAVAKYHRVEAAQDAGWGLLPGLDHCFEHPDGGMGIHYIDGAAIDTTLDPLHPEALVYNHLPNGKLRLGAVEYIVPIADWDAEGHGHPPMVLGQHLHPNEALGVYVLHAWIFTHNPDDIFNDWNPNVSCPD